MFDVMVDLETTGTNAHVHGILQVSAWKFDLKTLTILDEDPFNMAVSMSPQRGWDEGTIQWWHEESGRAAHLKKLRAGGRPPREVFEALQKWVGIIPQHVRLWAKPITFEYAFIDSYCRMLELPNPFHYRYCRDINTYVSALMGDPARIARDIDIPFEGQPHDALFDSLHDMRCLIEAQRRFNEGTLVTPEVPYMRELEKAIDDDAAMKLETEA